MRKSHISKFFLGLVSAIAILSLITGCYTKKQAISKFCKAENQVKDSTVFKYQDSIVWKNKYKDSIIIHPATEQFFNLDNLCDSLGRLRSIQINTRSGGNRVTIQSNGNTLTVKADCDSTVERYRHENDSLVHITNSSKVDKHTEVKIITEPRDKWWKYVPRWFWIYVLLATAALTWTIVKFVYL